MRQSDVQALFLKRFGELYPQLKFRGMRRFPSRTHGPYGLALRVAFGKAGIELDMLCVTLTDGYPEEVQRFLALIAAAEVRPPSTDAVPVLVAPFFSEEARVLCREAEIGYFDLAGNAGLDTPHVFLDVGERTHKNGRKKQLRSPFKGKAERVVRRLLLEPDRHWNMRELAKASAVSLGLTSMATSLLAAMKVVTKSRTGLNLYDAASLLETWAQGYDFRRSNFRIYRSAEQVIALQRHLVQQREALGDRYALTLWSGADLLLSRNDASSHLALYWLDKPESLADALRLSRTRGKTHVFVFQPYDESLLWGKQMRNGLSVAHPLQLYLDLGSGDEEELRLAQHVRERLLPW